MKKLVIIPTYNEKENIKKLIIKINSLGIANLDVLFVDDNSPDNSAAEIEEQMRENENIFLIKREGKLGLASAYLDGFKKALEKGYDVIVQMDADLSHDSKYLKDMFLKIEKYDFVIGSRYVEGGGVENWPLKRRLLSGFGSLYSRIILGVKIKDFTGGFNCWRSEVLRAIGLNNIKSEGYSFQIEMKYRAAKKGYNYCEVPIIFKERAKGKSKMSFKIIVEAVWKVWLLRFKKIS